MGNEISTLGGAVATAGTAIATGVIFGQIESVNNAVVEFATFTANHAKNTVVRHVGETAVMAVATAGASIAIGVMFGQITALNDAVVHCAKQTARVGMNTGSELVVIGDGLTDSVPIVGHVKGTVFYALGDHKRGARAMKSSTRMKGVIGGGVAGSVAGVFVGGPAGIITGGVAGGIAGGAAMDGIITGAEYGINEKYRPSGFISSATQVVTATTFEEGLTGIIGIVSTGVVDGLTGLASGTAVRVAMVRSNAATATTTVAEASVVESALEPGRLRPAMGTVGGAAAIRNACAMLVDGGMEIASGTVSDTSGRAEQAVANLTNLATTVPLPASGDAPNALTSYWGSLVVMGTDVLSAHLSRPRVAVVSPADTSKTRQAPNDAATSRAVHRRCPKGPAAHDHHRGTCDSQRGGRICDQPGHTLRERQCAR